SRSQPSSPGIRSSRGVTSHPGHESLSPSPQIPLPGGERVPVAAPVPLSTLHEQTYAGPLLAVDRDVDERRDANEVEAAGRHVAARDGDRLYCLVDRAGTDGLNLDSAFASDHARDRSRDGDRLRGGRNLEHLNWSALRWHCWNPFKHVHGRFAGWT